MGAASLDENEWGGKWHQADADSWQNADSWESAEGKKYNERVSAPYVIQIVNTCTSAISNVDILDSYLERTATNFGQVAPVAEVRATLTYSTSSWTGGSPSFNLIATFNFAIGGISVFTALGQTSISAAMANIAAQVLAADSSTNASYSGSSFTMTDPAGFGASGNSHTVTFSASGGGAPTISPASGTFSGGVTAQGGITITTNIVGVTYIEFLAQTEESPFTVGRTMIVSTSAGQLAQSLAITHRDATGNRADHVIPPIADPYQNQTDRVLDDYEYLADGFTRLRFNQINAGATVLVYLFPITKFSATQVVAGRNAKEVFKAPHIVKASLENLRLPKGTQPKNSSS